MHILLYPSFSLFIRQLENQTNNRIIINVIVCSKGMTRNVSFRGLQTLLSGQASGFVQICVNCFEKAI